jgi:hypothetical protein
LKSIETAVLRYHLNSEEFLKKVKDGAIDLLDIDTLEIFEKVLPKQAELQKLKEAVIVEGFSNVEEALN